MKKRKRGNYSQSRRQPGRRRIKLSEKRRRQLMRKLWKRLSQLELKSK